MDNPAPTPETTVRKFGGSKIVGNAVDDNAGLMLHGAVSTMK
jgi:hypothetical protein